MSWQANVDGLLNTKKVSEGAIINIGQKKIEAASSNFKLSKHTVELKNEKEELVKSDVDEIEVLLAIPEKKGLLPSPPGIWINGEVYHLIAYRDDVDSAYLKSEKGGATVTKTDKLIIVGVWNKKSDQNGGDCNDAVEKLAENFKSSGY